MITIFSVVRNYVLFNAFVRDNPCLSECKIIDKDNRFENKSITVRYNDFLESYDFEQPGWIIFCHEDFEFLENITKRLEICDTNCIYGICGIDFDGKAHSLMLTSNKDGSRMAVSGWPFKKAQKVSTFDCMCIIVHSDLIKHYSLRFDENLLFDLYAEDLCINVKENFNIDSYVLPIRSYHHSWGQIGERFFRQYEYVANKWKLTKRIYYNTLARRIGCGCLDETPYVPGYNGVFFRYFFKWMTPEGYAAISIFKHRYIIWKRQIVDVNEWLKANPIDREYKYD